VFFRF